MDISSTETLALRGAVDNYDDPGRHLGLAEAFRKSAMRGGRLVDHERGLFALLAYRRWAECVDNSQAWGVVGKNAMALGETEIALKCFERSLAADGNNHLSLSGQGQILVMLGKYADAATDLEKALQSAPPDQRDPWAALALGEAYHHLERPEDAVRTITEAATLHEQPGAGLVMAARRLRTLGYLTQARDVFVQACRHVKGSSREPGIRRELAQVERALSSSREGAAGPDDQPGPPAPSRIGELERLAKLLRDGVLTESEFAAEKQRVLDGRKAV